MQGGIFALLLIGALTAGIMGAGVAKPVVKDPKNPTSLRHGSIGHHRTHSNFSGK